MATHSSVLVWRIPGMGEPGGLPSMGSHRVGHDWSDLAAWHVVYVGMIFFFWSCYTTCGIVVPWPGMEPMPGELEAWSLNSWTTREVLVGVILISISLTVKDANHLWVCLSTIRIFSLVTGLLKFPDHLLIWFFVKQYKSSNFVLLFQNYVGYFGFFVLSYKFFN